MNELLPLDKPLVHKSMVGLCGGKSRRDAAAHVGKACAHHVLNVGSCLLGVGMGMGVGMTGLIIKSHAVVMHLVGLSSAKPASKVVANLRHA